MCHQITGQCGSGGNLALSDDSIKLVYSVKLSLDASNMTEPTEPSHLTMNTDGQSTISPRSLFSRETLRSLGSVLKRVWNSSIGQTESHGRSTDRTRPTTLGSDVGHGLAKPTKPTEVDVHVDYTDDAKNSISHADLVVSGSIIGQKFRYNCQTSQSHTLSEYRIQLIEAALIKDVKRTIPFDMIHGVAELLLVGLTLTPISNDTNLQKLEYHTACVWHTGDDGKSVWEPKEGVTRAQHFDLFEDF
jgi:hypothetical protein